LARAHRRRATAPASRRRRWQAERSAVQNAAVFRPHGSSDRPPHEVIAMSCRPAALLALPLLAVLLVSPGCAQLQEMLGRPTASIDGASLKGLDTKGVEVVFDVAVNNPYAVALPMFGLDYDLGHAGTSLARGTFDADGSIPAHGTRTLPVPVRLDFASLFALAGDIKPGSVVDYVADVGLSVDAPGIGNMRLPMKHEGSFPVPTVPEISLNSVHWDKLSLTEAAAVLDIGIRNTNAFAVDLSHLAYDLKLGGTPVASSGVDQALSLAGGAPGNLKLKLSLKPADLGMAAFNMLTGSSANYELGGRMTLGTQFGPLDLPYNRQGKVPFSK